MGISAPLRASPFFGGSSSTSTLVPYRYPVSIDGRPYMIDTQMAQEWRHETIPLLRPQSDQSETPGLGSLNPDGKWRRDTTSWHKGAGQTHRDRKESSDFRFRFSRGVNVWEPYELSLLNGTDKKRTSSNTNLKLVVCGDRLFLTDGAAVVYTEDISVDSPTWAATDNEPGGTILDIATDGKFVWITDGSNIYRADGTATPPDFDAGTPNEWSAEDADVLAYVKGYLLSAHDQELNYYAADGTPTAITLATGTLLNNGFTFVGFTGGPTNSVIYAAGNSGDKGLIFRIGILDDGSGLDVAVVAGELPDGENVRAIGSYLGQVLIGTDQGVRFAVPDGEGNLTMGALLETGSPCRCFEGQGPFVWFGWDDYLDPDYLIVNDYHGLGRLSLEEFSSADRLAPAYATDLMVVDDDGAVSSVVTFEGLTVFCIEGTDLGVYAETSTPATNGYVVGGLTDFGFTGDKIAIDASIAYTNPASGVVGLQVIADETGQSSPLGTVTTESQGVATFTAGSLRASRFDVIVAMTPGATSPTITSYHLQSVPAAADATRRIRIPLLIHETLDPDGSEGYFDVNEERNAVEGWWRTRQPITLNELGTSYTVVVEDFQWFPRMRDANPEGFAADGTLLVICKEI